MHISLRTIRSPANLIRLAIVALVALLTTVGSDGAIAAGGFNPQPAGTLSTTDPGSHPDIVASFKIGVGPDGAPLTPDDTGEYNFGGVLQYTPTTPRDAEIPDGAILGELKSVAVLGVLNNPCNRRVDIDTLPPKFITMEATTDNTNLVYSEPWGPTEPLGNNDLARLAGDTSPNPDGVQDQKPPPVVTQYPAFLNAIFDPDWVDFGNDHIAGNGDDNNGPAPPIKPIFRTVGVTSIGFAGNLWVILQSVVFEPGTKLPQLPALDAGYGFPSVTVLQTASAAGSATGVAPSAITDFCTPLVADIVSYGETHDNPDTPANEGGIPTRTLPAEPGTEVTTLGYYLSQRDADGDGFENGLDTCPLNADTVWNPHSLTNPAPDDQDSTAGLVTGDGIPATCDPDPNSTEPKVQGAQPTDYDGDGFPNSGDNCPLVANPDQFDKDPVNGEAGVGDGIGDACDPDTNSPNGNQILCIKLNTITVGGPHEAVIGDCLSEPPPLVGGKLPGANETGASGPGGESAAGTTAGRAGTGAGGGAAGGGAGGPASGVGSLSPVGGSVPAWAAIAAALGAAGVIGSAGTFASRLIKRRRSD